MDGRPCIKKLFFLSRAEALLEMDWINSQQQHRRDLGKSRKDDEQPLKDAYYCAEHRAWHLTSKKVPKNG